MRFKVERTFLVKSEEELELSPRNYLHCATIEELNECVEETINSFCEHPKVHGLQESEEIGMRYWNNWFEHDEQSFYQEWQKLKGLPQEL